MCVCVCVCDGDKRRFQCVCSLTLFIAASTVLCHHEGWWSRQLSGQLRHTHHTSHTHTSHHTHTHTVYTSSKVEKLCFFASNSTSLIERGAYPEKRYVNF